ncbi:SDR family NAD(P)-dependent oxidoreductase [Candidatus Leptofilum sp.]|uniref:SDR family NAD(P)-dependent oxidoreductase n=1 Tax=Candidatus Leptofilum sp. TaxID=3241576 RepID=UPI003B5B31AB
MATILITGATDGIGLAMARQYGNVGHRLILVGRRPFHTLTDPLPLFTKQNYCQADLAQPTANDTVANWLQSQQIESLDLLIHNAGTGYFGSLAAQTLDQIDELLTVNLHSPIALTHKLFPWLYRAQGRVVFVSSVATAVPTPEYAVYGASKAALEGFVRSLRVEWQGKVTVQTISPGATRTGMHQKIGLTQAQMNWEKFPSAETVASKIIRTIDSKRPSATIGFGNKLLRFVGRNGRFLLDPVLQKSAPQLNSQAQPKTPPTCLITGAADGIGRALAFRYAQAGYHIVGLDIDEKKAAQTHTEIEALGGNVNFVIGDLGNRAGLAAILPQLATFAPFNYVVHNAGISTVGRFETVPLEKQQAVLHLNLHAPLWLTAELFKRNWLTANASFVFLSSLSYFASYPGAAVYAASKDGLANYARSLQAAWQDGRCLTVFPGPTRTAHARRYSPDNSREDGRMPPETLAEAIFHAEQAGKSRLIPGTQNKVMGLAGHLFPNLLELGMKKMILEKLDGEVI